jgi:predicted DCC family thiol-disulfide oxidoreductase YuxK
VKFIVRFDLEGKIRFSGLNSEYSQKTLPSDLLKIDSVIVKTHEGHFLTKSEAVFYILKKLRPSYLFNIFQLFSILPLSVTDFFYDRIAKIRYKLFGRSKNVNPNICPIPNMTIVGRFLF